MQTEVREYLLRCRELAALCSQNGWIDDDTLSIDILEEDDDGVTCAVTFEEIVMEGSGCVAGRVPCYGRVRLGLDETGEVTGMDVL